jgi:hypothetical protein
MAGMDRRACLVVVGSVPTWHGRLGKSSLGFVRKGQAEWVMAWQVWPGEDSRARHVLSRYVAAGMDRIAGERQEVTRLGCERNYQETVNGSRGSVD